MPTYNTPQRPSKRDDGWPTRSDIRYDTDPERLCRILLGLVEGMGASTSLTRAVMLLDNARNAIADHVEQIDVAGVDLPAPPVNVLISINRLPYEQEQREVTAADVLAMPFPAISDSDVWVYGRGVGVPDWKLTGSVRLENGMAFYTAPRLINAGSDLPAPTQDAPTTDSDEYEADPWAKHGTRPGQWLHREDGSPCPEQVPNGRLWANEERGRMWWCTTHQMHLVHSSRLPARVITNGRERAVTTNG